MKTPSSFFFKCLQYLRSTLLALVWFVVGTICVFADAPTLTIDQPADGASFVSPADVTIAATVSDSAGVVTGVDFTSLTCNGYTVLGTVTAPPYQFTLTNLVSGNYTFYVCAQPGFFCSVVNFSFIGPIQSLVNAAAPGSTVDIPAGVYLDTVIINKNLTLRGAGARSTTIDGNNGCQPAFVVAAGATVTLSGLTVTRGGILNNGTLTVNDCAITGNRTLNEDSAVRNTISGTAILNNCTVSGNVDGGIANDGAMILNGCTISGNFCCYDPEDSGGNGGGISNNGTLSLNNCTVTGNTAGSDRGGCCGLGGGIANSASGTVSCQSTIIANNLGGGFIVQGTRAPDFSGDLNSQGYNLIGDTTGAVILGITTGNLLNIAPSLGPLQNNGGPTDTHALPPGSPAIDAGISGGQNTDQRGFPRPIDIPSLPNAADGSDIGAYEFNGPPTAGITCQFDIVANNDPGQCSAVINYPAPVVTGGTGNVVVVCNPPSGFAFPVGITTVTCTATDSSGNPATCSFNVTVHDTEFPAITSLTATPSVLRPINNQLIPVNLDVVATDNCSPIPCQIIDVRSSDPIIPMPNGSFEPYWLITGNLSLSLRAGRNSPDVERIYTITVECGNASRKTVDVIVPKCVLCPAAPPITVNVYSGFQPTGGGTPYSGLVGTLTASGVTFARDNAYAWHPFGLGSFGADITGSLDVLANGTYTFTLNSDDGSLLFIDGNLVVDNGDHPPTIRTGSATLTAGSHPFEVQFFECCGGRSGVDLSLPTGVSYTCRPPVLFTEGDPLAWGDGRAGQLGDGNFYTSPPFGVATAVQVSGLTTVTAIAGGGNHSLALKSDGTVWAWGHGDSGQLGDGNFYFTGNKGVATPVQVSGLTTVTAIAGGQNHSLALKSDGTVWAWGNFQSFFAGVAPVQVSGLSTVTAIASGGQHGLALKSDGTVWAWGWGSSGQLGDGNFYTTGNQGVATPVQVNGLTTVTAIAGGGAHSLALKSDGTVWAWGNGYNGQLGDGNFYTTGNQGVATPVQVSGLSSVVAIDGGEGHSLALKSDGTVWAWGWGANGELGDGNFATRATPVQVSGLTTVRAIAGGYQHSLALKSDGTVWAWGDGNLGELGDGNFYVTGYNGVATPVQVNGLFAVVAIAAGGEHSLALPGNPPAANTPLVITSLTATPSLLRPVNNRFTPVRLDVVTTDDCGSTTCNIISVTSSDPIIPMPSGRLEPYWLITGNLSLYLRAGLNTPGVARTYTITVGCTDPLGNMATKTVDVIVPK